MRAKVALGRSNAIVGLATDRARERQKAAPCFLTKFPEGQTDFKDFKIFMQKVLLIFLNTHSPQMQNDSIISIPCAVGLARRDAEAGELFFGRKTAKAAKGCLCASCGFKDAVSFALCERRRPWLLCLSFNKNQEREGIAVPCFLLFLFFNKKEKKEVISIFFFLLSNCCANHQ